MSVTDHPYGPGLTTMSLWHAIGRQLQRPSGLAGRLTGLLMRIANEKPNRLAVEALNIASRDTVLELGFGPGHAIEMIASRATAGIVYGIDQSQTMLEQARQRNHKVLDDGRVFLYQASFDRLPFEDRSIDKILAVNVIYFWADIPAVLKEIHRVLRPNGRVVIYATEASTMRRWKFARPDTHRLFEAAELATALCAGALHGHDVSVSKVRIAGRIHGLLATISMLAVSSESTAS